jgi:methylmalonyl-CoA mutase cobalamin-binding subunit
MLEILKELKNSYNVDAVKAEFEAEGTRADELLRLLEIARRADLKVALKIGGCEAVRDLIEAKQFGVDYIIAPMVETPYALQKFIDAKNKIFSEAEQFDVDFLVNLETKTGFDNHKEFAKVASVPRGIDGLVFGRVDYVGSKSMTRDSVDGEAVTSDCIQVAESCKQYGLDLVVGGGVSNNAVPSLTAIMGVHLSRFETRKIVFSAASLSSNKINEGLVHAVQFELLWLLNKREYYSNIAIEDDQRIKMLEARWGQLRSNP